MRFLNRERGFCVGFGKPRLQPTRKVDGTVSLPDRKTGVFEQIVSRSMHSWESPGPSVRFPPEHDAPQMTEQPGSFIHGNKLGFERLIRKEGIALATGQALPRREILQPLCAIFTSGRMMKLFVQVKAFNKKESGSCCTPNSLFLAGP